MDHVLKLSIRKTTPNSISNIYSGNDKELQKLTKEIQEMKKQRVDLLKNMRAENKKFQQFKNAKNKEIVQIKR